MGGNSARAASAPALPQLPKLGLQRLARRLFFPQAVLRLSQLPFGLLQAVFSLFQVPLGLPARLRLFPVSPQILTVHRIIKV